MVQNAHMKLLLEPPDKDTVRILMCTDTHLGVHENDLLRRGDSFRAFDEALTIGRLTHCDFVLHGGDLFHENHPSRHTLEQAIRLLSKHVLLQQCQDVEKARKECQVSFDIVSDQKRNFPCAPLKCANFAHPALNVRMPIFMVHGNHDDPVGGAHSTQRPLSAVDLLSAAQLVNYFGTQNNISKVDVDPLLIKKGATSLAMYGIGAMRDERLRMMFEQQKVTWRRPGNPEDWFNVLVIHQNRVCRNEHINRDAIAPELLPKFLDLLYWAHEHESKPFMEDLSDHIVIQPGSTVQASLHQSEALPKHVVVLDVRRQQLRATAVPLETARVYHTCDFNLSDYFVPPDGEGDLETISDERLLERLREFVEIAVNEAEGKRLRGLSALGLSDQVPPASGYYASQRRSSDDRNARTATPAEQAMLPLVRVRVNYAGGFSRPNKSLLRSFASSVQHLVANPHECVHLFSRGNAARKKKTAATATAEDAVEIEFEQPAMSAENKSAEITNYVLQMVADNAANEKKALTVLAGSALTRAVECFADKKDAQALERCLKEEMCRVTRFLGVPTEEEPPESSDGDSDGVSDSDGDSGGDSDGEHVATRVKKGSAAVTSEDIARAARRFTRRREKRHFRRIRELRFFSNDPALPADGDADTGAAADTDGDTAIGAKYTKARTTKARTTKARTTKARTTKARTTKAKATKVQTTQAKAASAKSTRLKRTKPEPADNDTDDVTLEDLFGKAKREPQATPGPKRRRLTRSSRRRDNGPIDLT